MSKLRIIGRILIAATLGVSLAWNFKYEFSEVPAPVPAPVLPGPCFPNYSPYAPPGADHQVRTSTITE